MKRYAYTATFSTGEVITRKTKATYGHAWAAIQDGKVVKSGFAVRPEGLYFVFSRPRSIVKVVDPDVVEMHE